MRGAWQHGHRWRLLARATVRGRRRVAIGLVMCRQGVRPRPDQVFAGNGSIPGAHTLMFGSISGTWENPRAMISVRSSVSVPYPAFCEHDPTHNVGFDSVADVLERDRRIGREADIARQAGLVAPDRTHHPVLRRTEPICYRQARAVTTARRSILLRSPGSNNPRQ